GEDDEVGRFLHRRLDIGAAAGRIGGLEGLEGAAQAFGHPFHADLTHLQELVLADRVGRDVDEVRPLAFGTTRLFRLPRGLGGRVVGFAGGGRVGTVVAVATGCQRQNRNRQQDQPCSDSHRFLLTPRGCLTTGGGG